MPPRSVELLEVLMAQPKHASVSVKASTLSILYDTRKSMHSTKPTNLSEKDCCNFSNCCMLVRQGLPLFYSSTNHKNVWKSPTVLLPIPSQIIPIAFHWCWYWHISLIKYIILQEMKQQSIYRDGAYGNSMIFALNGVTLVTPCYNICYNIVESSSFKH